MKAAGFDDKEKNNRISGANSIKEALEFEKRALVYINHALRIVNEKETT